MDYFGKVAAGWGPQGLADLNQKPGDLGPIIANQQAAAAAVGAAAGAFPSFQKGPLLPFSGFGAPGSAMVERPSALTMAHGAGGLKVAAMAGAKKVGGSSSAGAGASGKAGESRRKWAPNRKAAGFWGPFNDWWRQEFARVGRRPSTEEVSAWYVDHADKAWKGNKPSIKETRRHAKCLRTTEDVRNYFRKYRAKRSSIAQGKKHKQDALKQAQQAGVKKAHQLHYPTPGTSVLKSSFGVKGVNPAAVGLLPDATGGAFDSVNSALNRAAWSQQHQGMALGAMAAQYSTGKLTRFNSGANTSAQNEMLNAMYRNYQQQTVPAQANQAAQLANTFAFIQNPSLMYQVRPRAPPSLPPSSPCSMPCFVSPPAAHLSDSLSSSLPFPLSPLRAQTANTVNLAGCNAALARNYTQGTQPRQMQVGQQAGAANPSSGHGPTIVKQGDPGATQTTESPNSTETTEPVDRAATQTPSPLEVAQVSDPKTFPMNFSLPSPTPQTSPLHSLSLSLSLSPDGSMNRSLLLTAPSIALLFPGSRQRCRVSFVNDQPHRAQPQLDQHPHPDPLEKRGGEHPLSGSRGPAAPPRHASDASEARV